MFPYGLIVFVALLGFALRGHRWAYGLFVARAIIYFPARVGFRLDPQPCEVELTLPLALHSLQNYKHIVLLALFFLMTRAQFGTGTVACATLCPTPLESCWVWRSPSRGTPFGTAQGRPEVRVPSTEAVDRTSEHFATSTQLGKGVVRALVNERNVGFARANNRALAERARRSFCCSIPTASCRPSC